MSVGESFETEFEYGGKKFGMILPSREDYISKKIVTDKTFYECAYLEALAALLDQGDCVLDVGANIGNHTVYFAGVVGCRVHAFEPIPSTFAVLEENIRRNGLDGHVQAHMLALGDGDGHAEVAAFDPGNLGGTTLRLKDHGDIRVSSIDHLELCCPVRLIKIDAEGMDVSVLAGAKKLIERDRPVLACEAASATEYEHLKALLDKHGYVSVACYNATDTYIFLPARSLAEREALMRYGFDEIISLQRNAMAVQARFAQAGRYAERVAKEQGEKAGTQIVSLRARVDDVIHRQDTWRIEADVKIEKTVDEFVGSIEALRGRMLDGQMDIKKKMDELLAQLKRQGDEMQKKLKVAEKSLDSAEMDLARLRTSLSSEIEKKLVLEQAVRTAVETGDRLKMEFSRSITFQVGSSFASAMSSMQGLIKLPVRLFRIRREMKRRHKMQLDPAGWNVVVPVQFPQSMHLPLAVPSASFLNKPMTVMPPGTEPVAAAFDAPALPAMPAHAEDARMAVIMDEFTHASYAPCCHMERLYPESGVRQLETFRPNIMFVESAWRGENGEWERKVRHGDPHLLALIQWCRQHRVPSAFWNKEDPVHFETFIATARLFDYVFTTDIDCIARYKSLLGHDRVYLLPFACQPESHNPIEKYERKDATCFAGAYYVRYPERQRDFDTIIQSLQQTVEVDIYDRNFGKDDVNYMFPESYAPLIKGGLAFEDIDVAYKGYHYGINLNSVKQSQTMFARRVFDLLGCNTVTISNFSRGLRLLFGDLVLATDNGAELQRRLAPYRGRDNASNYRKFRLLGLRKVLGEHTYADRLAYIMSKMGGCSATKRMPEIRVLSRVTSMEQAGRVVQAFRRQVYDSKHLYLLVTEDTAQAVAGIYGDGISVLSRAQSQALIPAEAWSGSYLAVFSSRDYYGPTYLTDLAQATLYSSDSIIGKASFYQGGEGPVPTLLHDGQQYKPSEKLAPRRSITSADTIEIDVAGWCQSEDVNLSIATFGLATDEFNYVADSDVQACPVADDLTGVDIGMSLKQLLHAAEGIKAQQLDPEEGVYVLPAAALLGSFNRQASAGKVKMCEENGDLVLVSQLAVNEHAYLHAKDKIPLQGWAVNDEVSFHLDAELGLFVQPAMLFFDGQGERVGHCVKFACRNTTVPVPEQAVAVQLALRVAGTGRCRINRWVLGKMPWASSLQMSKADMLLVTNVYPSYDQLYRNGFIHRRVKGYEAKGLKTEVFCLSNEPGSNYREFENVNVTTGWKNALRDKLQSNRYRSILVHFFDVDMWEVLREVVGQTKIWVWVHGFEIQHWKRRTFNYVDDHAFQKAKEQSDKRMTFWAEVLAHAHPNLNFVFVSKDLAESAFDDLGVRLSPERYSIIHNIIDGDLFSYAPKPVEQRLRVLSIRPYATRMYANDLSVKAILAMRDDPAFSKMEFRIIGDGPLFEETLAPLMKADLPNVVIQRGFLPQKEIAKIHKEYGVFLVPTRWDSQGVSRDEAMASGLVPVTTAVAAIPEFVDERCGIVVPPEDAQAMAEQMLALVHDPARFQALSEAAAKRVRAQSGYAQTIEAELDLIKGR